MSSAASALATNELAGSEWPHLLDPYCFTLKAYASHHDMFSNRTSNHRSRLSDTQSSSLYCVIMAATHECRLCTAGRVDCCPAEGGCHRHRVEERPNEVGHPQRDELLGGVHQLPLS